VDAENLVRAPRNAAVWGDVGNFASQGEKGELAVLKSSHEKGGKGKFKRAKKDPLATTLKGNPSGPEENSPFQKKAKTSGGEQIQMGNSVLKVKLFK